MPSRWSQAVLVLVITCGGETNAFVAPSHPTAKFADVSSTTARFSESDPLRGMFGEQSRPYRRTVYTHDDWVKHRSSDRFLKNLSSLTSSGIYKSLAKEVVATTAVATFVVIWNCLVGGYTDLFGVTHGPIIPPNDVFPILGLPLTPFTLVSPSLGLLLVFRTNSSYGRWDEARKFWGLNINHTRDLNRMATAWYGDMGDGKLRVIDEENRAEDLKAISLCTWAFVRSMKRHLSPVKEDESAFKAEIYERLPAEQASILVAAPHRPNRALYDLSMAIDALPMHFLRKNQINTALGIFEDTLGGSERLLSSPVPLFYSRHTARFLSVWLLLLPFALWEPFKGSWNHVGEIPAVALISVCLFGIEELATQLEEPFTILPMQGFCDKIGANCDEIVSWAGAGQEKMTAAKGDMQEDFAIDDADEDPIVTSIGDEDPIVTSIGEDAGNVDFDDASQEDLVAVNDEEPNELMSSISGSRTNIDGQDDAISTEVAEPEDSMELDLEEDVYTRISKKQEEVEVVSAEGDEQKESIISKVDEEQEEVIASVDGGNDNEGQDDPKYTEDALADFVTLEEVPIDNDLKEEKDLIAAKDDAQSEDVVSDVQQEADLISINADEPTEVLAATTSDEEQKEFIKAGGIGQQEELMGRDVSSVEMPQSSSLTKIDSPDLELMRIRLEVEEIRSDLKLTNEALLQTENALAELQSEVAVMRTQKDVQEDVVIAANSSIEKDVMPSVTGVQEDVLSINGDVQEDVVSTVGDLQGEELATKKKLQSGGIVTDIVVQDDMIATADADVLKDPVTASGDGKEDVISGINGDMQEDVVVAANGDVQDDATNTNGDGRNDVIATNGDVQQEVIATNGDVQEDSSATKGDGQEDVIATNGDVQEDVIATNGYVQEDSSATNGDRQEDVIATNCDVLEDLSSTTGANDVGKEDLISVTGVGQNDLITINRDIQEVATASNAGGQKDLNTSGVSNEVEQVVQIAANSVEGVGQEVRITGNGARGRWRWSRRTGQWVKR